MPIVKKSVPDLDAEGNEIKNADGTTKMVEIEVEENAPPAEDFESKAAARYKADMLKYKQQAQDAEKKINDMKVQGHKEKEDWKTVASIHESRANELETKYSGLKDSLVNNEKNRKLREEALKHGINPVSLADLELLDFDELSVETTSNGKILVTGADRAIAKLKTIRPHWFTKNVPGVNPNTPNLENPTPNGLVTTADLNAAEAKWKKSHSDADKKAYGDLIQKYKAQPG